MQNCHREQTLHILTYIIIHYFLIADFEGIEVHSRKVFNNPKDKTTIKENPAEESLGPMVRKGRKPFF